MHTRWRFEQFDGETLAVEDKLMSKRKRQNKKWLDSKDRLKDAARWLVSRDRPRRPLIESYCKRYTVTQVVAWDELVALGCYDQLCIEQYEQDGIEWEYKYEARSGNLLVVPKGTEDHELYEIHGLF